jgi:hypothetical protein
MIIQVLYVYPTLKLKTSTCKKLTVTQNVHCLHTSHFTHCFYHTNGVGLTIISPQLMFNTINDFISSKKSFPRKARAPCLLWHFGMHIDIEQQTKPVE